MALDKPTYDVNNIQGLATLVQDQEVALKVLFDKTGADAKTYLIALCDQLDLDFATKVDLANAIISSVFPSGSVGDIALSDAHGQIKERFTTHESLSASDVISGHIELATTTETTTGTDDTKAVHPAGLKIELDKKARIVSGSYTGDGVAKTINTGVTPKYVVILKSTATPSMFVINGVGIIATGTVSVRAALTLVSGGFTIGAVGNDANNSGDTYNWTVVG